jgi:endoglucanase
MLGIVLLGGSLGIAGCVSEGAGGGAPDENDPRAPAVRAAATCPAGERGDLFAPPPSDGSLAQVRDLWQAKDYANARKLLALVSTPHAAWFAGGSPEEVRQAVHQTTSKAEKQHRLPVLVAYNLPYRDCAQYSSGGAVDSAAYRAWIDGFARGIGHGQAIVILEPDGLGIIPYNQRIDGPEEWCQPTVTDAAGNVVPAPGASPAERYAQINYAVDSLADHAPHAAVYLDASNSGWLGVGEAAYRLTRAGVLRARGFFLNVSNYQRSSENVQYGSWVSMALAAPSGAPAWAFDDSGHFHFDWLPSQYDPAQGYAINYDPAYAATVTAGLQAFMGDAVATIPFIIDTGRNGQGPFQAAAYALAPYNQPASVVSGLATGYWCNGFGAGAGLRPTTRTGVALLDAYLWIKVPGESDGSCDIAGGARAWDFGAYNPWGVTGDAQNHFDPLWGQVDPEAGKWFPAQGLQLAQNANPSLP